MNDGRNDESRNVTYYKKNEKGGRPRAYENKRNRMIMCYVNDAEFAEIETKRIEQNLTRGAYIRKSIFQNVIPKFDSQALLLFANATNNINQIARKMNSAPADNPTSVIFRDDLLNIQKLLKALYQQKFGGYNESQDYARE